MKLSIILLQPFFKNGAVLVGLFDETSVSGAFEDFPAAVGDVLIERGGDDWGADVARAAANEAGLFDLVQAVGVFKVGQIAQRLVFVGSPSV